MNYLMQEGLIAFPDNPVFMDETVNILRFPDYQASLVISRTRLSSGQTPDVYLSRQIAQLKKDCRHFLAGEPEPVLLGTVPALEISSSFEKQGVKIYQQLLCTQQFPDLLVLTFSRLSPPDKDSVLWWQQIKASFTAHNA